MPSTVGEVWDDFMLGERFSTRIGDNGEKYFYLQLVVAYDDFNRGIGNKGKLLWDIPEERKKFFYPAIKDTVLVVGRKTFDTLPEGFFKKVEGYPIIVVTRSAMQLSAENTHTANSAESVLELCDRLYPTKAISVIGGGEIYKMFLPYADRLDESFISSDDSMFMEADTFYPEISREERNTLHIRYSPSRDIIFSGEAQVCHAIWDFLKRKKHAYDLLLHKWASTL